METKPNSERKNLLTQPSVHGLYAAMVVFFSATISIITLYHAARRAHFAEMQSNLVSLAEAGASLIDPELHKTFVSPEQEGTEEYRRQIDPMYKMLRSVSGLKYLYTAIVKDDQIFFVLDSVPHGDSDGDGVDDHAVIMEAYEDAEPTLLEAVRQRKAMASEAPYTDKWGTFMTGFAPIFDASGEVVGVVGADMTAGEFSNRLAVMKSAAWLGMIPALMVSTLTGFGIAALKRNAARLVQKRSQAEQKRSETTRVLVSVQKALLGFVETEDMRSSLGAVLSDCLAVTNSAYGFIGEVLRDERNRPYLVTQAITDIAWDDQSRAIYSLFNEGGLEFRNLNTLFGAVMTGGAPMIANDPPNHPHAGGLPSGHPPLTAFLGMPVLNGPDLVGMIGIANRPGGYDQEIIDMLRPIVATSGCILASYRSAVGQKRAEEELIKSRADAILANRAKSEFLAHVSHEIRTPLTAILGFSDMLLEPSSSDTLTPAQRDAASTIRRSGDHLLSVINDIIDISKIEAGKMDVERIPVSIESIVTDVLGLFSARAREKKLDFSVEFESDIPARTLTDPTRLRQVLSNLVGNAVKFTSEGSVRLLVRFTNRTGTPFIEIDVIDSGIGLTEEQAEKLFKPFTQADTSMSRRFGGTGLGLAISRRLAVLLGGDVVLHDSKPGAGTTFRVSVETGDIAGIEFVRPRLQTAERTKPAVLTQAAIPSLNCRILLAEDGPDNQRLLLHILQKKAGAMVTLVENGKLALDAAWEAHQNGNPFDVILMDIQMPVMDGYIATMQLRERGYEGKIIALTAHAMSSDREKCINAGCDDFASKPINPATLIATIRKAIEPALTAIGS